MKIRIYTDGSCSGNPGPGGWAATIAFPEKKRIITGGNPDTTNNAMELKAVLESLRYIYAVAFDGNASKSFKSIDIYSDSTYVVNGISKHWAQKWADNGWKTVAGDDVKNRSVWEDLLLIIQSFKRKHIKVNLIKVKGHSNDWSNNQVDKLAKEEVKKLQKRLK